MTKRKPIVKPVETIVNDTYVSIGTAASAFTMRIDYEGKLVIWCAEGRLDKETAKYLRRQLSSYITKGRFTVE